MENQEQENTKPKATMENPKPTDDVQLTIETVTPDTACTTVPKTPVKTEEVKKEVEGANHNDENERTNQNVNEQELVDEKEDQTTDEAEVDAKEESGEDEASAEEVEDSGVDKEEGDDERDQIETVAP